MKHGTGTAFALAALAASSAHATVVVSNAATQHMSCSAGVCTPTAQNAVLNAGDLQSMLASSDVTIVTGSIATEIHVIAPVTWASASRLTLDARRSIAIRAAVVSQGTGSVTITTNDGGSGGDLNFVSGGAVSVGSVAYVAGFTVSAAGTLTTSWSSGAVGAADPNHAQGFTFEPPDSAADDYWDIDSSGQSTGCGGTCTGVTGLTTAQFQSGLPSGFDPAVWAQSASVNNGYPYLIANPPQ
jgi:hypothetical protein